MPLSRTRDYLSIGEVLESVKEDFPDVSISKIRFLEAEGLIMPERTPSGYRKFYEPDVARLRFILSLQRDHFLPLKVIRERLAEADSNGGVASPPTVLQPAPPARQPDEVAAGVQMSRAELLSAAGLTDQQLRGLEEYGLLDSGRDAYDEDDLIVCSAAVKFFSFGLEPRHIKMYKQFADREAAFFEQIVTPVAARRDPDGQRRAAQSVRELVALSRQLREALLRAGTRHLL